MPRKPPIGTPRARPGWYPVSAAASRGGRLLRIAKTGEAREVLAGFYQLADLGYDPTGHTLAMPVMSDHRLIFLHLGVMP